ncbi:hypothetical protein [Piscirickettsia litoralis]|uniref:UspA domain-containing protein n=1 Tax=Piscirickettsia litoralis TaxID=1891921 RepID=A0ABX3A2I1_9GAMM|nr:hypothetical protein [Piscirickettsia litoralis]ODN41843.1 hypothetical protein BGC07_01205 [Piscirickettsia litoralis]
MPKYEHVLYVTLLKHNVENDINYVWRLCEQLKSRLGFALLIPTSTQSERYQESEHAFLNDHILKDAYEKLTAASRLLKVPQQDLYLHAGECLYKLLERLLSRTRPDLIILPSSLSFEERGHCYETIMDKGASILKLATTPVIAS